MGAQTPRGRNQSHPDSVCVLFSSAGIAIQVTHLHAEATSQGTSDRYFSCQREPTDGWSDMVSSRNCTDVILDANREISFVLPLSRPDGMLCLSPAVRPVNS